MGFGSLAESFRGYGRKSKKTDAGAGIRINMGLSPHGSSHHTAAATINSITSIATETRFAGAG